MVDVRLVQKKTYCHRLLNARAGKSHLPQRDLFIDCLSRFKTTLFVMMTAVYHHLVRLECLQLQLYTIVVIMIDDT